MPQATVYTQLDHIKPESVAQRREYCISLLKSSGIDPEILNTQFVDDDLLIQTFVHKSYAADYPFPVPHNERLEFLGDSILGATIASALYRDYPTHKESQLTLSKIYLVKEPTLAQVARSIDLGDQIYLGNGETKTGGADKDSVLSDGLEAVIGYLSIVTTPETVAHFIETHIYTLLSSMPLPSKSYKSKLQEAVQKKLKTVPTYETTIYEQERTGNVLMYKSVVHIDGRPYGTGYGKNKKAAHEAAAQEALHLYTS